MCDGSFVAWLLSSYTECLQIPEETGVPAQLKETLKAIQDGSLDYDDLMQEG